MILMKKRGKKGGEIKADANEVDIIGANLYSGC